MDDIKVAWASGSTTARRSAGVDLDHLRSRPAVLEHDFR